MAQNCIAQVAFSTCSYLTSTRSPRARIVKEALETWDGLLDLGFCRRFFVDDRSPSCSATNALLMTSVSSKFDDIRYTPFCHPPHSNFGIVYSFDIADAPYILHLDDDVKVRGSRQKLLQTIQQAVELMDNDSNLLGINLLTLDKPDESQKQWKPKLDYSRDPSNSFAHPAKFFGTCASLIRRDLLNKMTLDEVISLGDAQPAGWEESVSHDTKQFLVSQSTTPFFVDQEAWSVTASSSFGLRKQAKAIRRQAKAIIKKLT